jgi:energy-coupling factor transport system substrate-specific component
MLELITMWKNPRLVAAVALTAALYAASLVPLKGFTAVNGMVDLGRVGIAIPIVFSFLFGPAAAWGAALGNVIGDIAGAQFNAGSIFGFLANLLIGYVPYRIWTSVTLEKPEMKKPLRLLLFVAISILVCLIAGVIIGWGLNWLGWVPFIIIAPIIAITNSIWAISIGPIFLSLTYNFVENRKMLYYQVENKNPARASIRLIRKFAAMFLAISTIACFSGGVIFGLNTWQLLPLLVVMFVAAAAT